MAKTFEEWYESEYLSVYLDEAIENSSFDSHLDIKEFLEKAWDASRQNMTTRDI